MVAGWISERRSDHLLGDQHERIDRHAAISVGADALEEDIVDGAQRRLGEVDDDAAGPGVTGGRGSAASRRSRCAPSWTRPKMTTLQAMPTAAPHLAHDSVATARSTGVVGPGLAGGVGAGAGRDRRRPRRAA